MHCPFIQLDGMIPSRTFPANGKLTHDAWFVILGNVLLQKLLKSLDRAVVVVLRDIDVFDGKKMLHLKMG